MHHALLIIDQQQGIDHPKLGPRNNPQAESVMLELLKIFREYDWPIFHIRHCSKEVDSVFWPGQSGYEFKPSFEPRDGEFILEKEVPCAFVNNSLEQKLRELRANSVLIVGVATNNSVESTARTAGNLGFNVTVLEDACFTFAKADYFGELKTAQQVHAMSLANLHGEYATVMHSSDFVQSLSA